MSNSIRELICVDVLDSLKVINKDEGYNFNIEDDNINFIHGSKSESTYKEPYIYVYPGPELIIMDKAERSKTFKTLALQIETWLRVENKEDMNTDICKVLADIEKALMTNPSRGGYAIDTRLVSNETFIESINSPRCAILLTVEIDYQNKYNDPAIL